MHYMGMAAAVFLPYANCRYVTNQEELGLTLFVGLMTLFIFGQGLYLVSKGFLTTTSLRDKIFSNLGFYGVVSFICICGLGAMALLHSISTYNENIALETFKKEQQIKSESIQTKFKDFFEAAYTNIRTISRLPSVRGIDRHATNLSPNDRITIQENYNNLANLIAVSEVYIISKDFDPGKMDPITKKLEEPIIMFDHIIVGRTKDDYVKKEAEEDPNKPGADEIEIEEYHLIKEQIAYFQKHYPTLDTIKGFDVPAISGREVITCDNSRYSPKTPNDADRSGFVYSVPFYDMIRVHGSFE
jgi:hypothetical protein